MERIGRFYALLLIQVAGAQLLEHFLEFSFGLLLFLFVVLDQFFALFLFLGGLVLLDHDIRRLDAGLHRDVLGLSLRLFDWSGDCWLVYA